MMKHTGISGEQAVIASQRNKEKEYWLEKLAGLPGKVSFPYDRTEGTSGREPRNRVTFEIIGELQERMIKVMAGSDSRLHMILTASVILLLEKYTDQQDIVIGAPVLRQEEEIEFANTVLILRILLKETKTFKDLLYQVKEAIYEATENQNYPIEVLMNKLNLENTEQDFPLFDVAVHLENIQKKRYIDYFPLNILFSFHRIGEEIKGTIEYDSGHFNEAGIQRYIRNYLNLLRETLFQVEVRISEVDILSDQEKNLLLEEFNQTKAPYPEEQTLHQLFEQQVKDTPDQIAISYQDLILTYIELDKKANQIALYLRQDQEMQGNRIIGVLMERSLDLVPTLLGILKSGAAYLPLEPTFPEERIECLIRDAKISVLISQKKNLRILNRLLWECPSMETYLCLDTEDVCRIDEEEKIGLMDKKLWEYVGETATDEITGGGWFSSYTGEPISKKEMDEYGDNVLLKLEPFLKPGMRVLEIGCASGITMYRIAPKVGYYCGVDLSRVIIETNKKRIKKEGHKNIDLYCLAAHEIDQLESKGFHLVIINSVIQNFPGHNHLRKVLKKAVDLMDDTGLLFVGDVMDQDLKKDLIRDMQAFKKDNKDKGYRTKTDWTAELFVSRGYFEDLELRIPEIKKKEFSQKIHTIKNELTRFRFDALLTIDKKKRDKGSKQISQTKPRKNQQDLSTLKKYPGTQGNFPVSNRDLAYVIYTSGSTGEPKGVMIEHRAIVNRLNWMQRNYPIGKGDVILQKTTIVFDVSVWELFWWALNGATCRLLEPGDQGVPKALLESIRRNKITHLHFVPSLLNEFLEALSQEKGMNLNSVLKQVFSSGEALKKHQVEKFYQFIGARNHTRIVNLYGPTEAAVDVSSFDCHFPEYQHFDQIPIGKPIDNITLYILNRNRKLVPMGGSGELYISGLGLARGYLGREDLTRESFVENPYRPGEKMYRTGDLARWLPKKEANIEYLGRIDQQIKIRGFRIELGEIEQKLISYEEVRDAVVVAGEDEAGDGFLCAYLQLEFSEATGDIENRFEITELRDYLSRSLPAYMIPAYFMKVEAIPKTPSGKTDKKSLPKPQLEKSQKYIAPKDDIEFRLVRIWSEVLGVNKDIISVDSNFFELGGHSLRATIMVSKIRKEFSVEFPLGEVFNGPYIRDFARVIKSNKKNIYEDIKPVEKKEYYPQSSAQKRLYFLDRFESIGTCYNTPSILKVFGAFDKEKYQRSLDQLVQRHETLRTTFQVIQDAPVQIVQDEFFIEIQEMAINSGQKMNIGIQEATEGFLKPFNLETGPLLRVGILPLNEKENVLFYDIHHIISDGTALRILIDDFFGIYTEESMEPIQIQYKDFSHWQNQLFETGQIKKQEDYWLDRFSSLKEIPQLRLPADFQRKEVMSFEGDDFCFVMEKDLLEGFKEMGARNEVTLYMNLLAVFNVLLYKYSGQEHIIVGTGIAGRHHVRIQSIIGLFVNNLVMLNNPGSEETFKEFLSRVRENSIRAFENQDFQFEELVNKLNLQRSASRNPLFTVVLEVSNFEPSQKIMREVEFSPFEIKKKISRYDMILYANEKGERVYFKLEYSTELFKRKTIQDMAAHLFRIIQQVNENDEIRIMDIELVGLQEKMEIERQLEEGLEKVQTEFDM